MGAQALSVLPPPARHPEFLPVTSPLPVSLLLYILFSPLSASHCFLVLPLLSCALLPELRGAHMETPLSLLPEPSPCSPDQGLEDS